MEDLFEKFTEKCSTEKSSTISPTKKRKRNEEDVLPECGEKRKKKKHAEGEKENKSKDLANGERKRNKKHREVPEEKEKAKKRKKVVKETVETGKESKRKKKKSKELKEKIAKETSTNNNSFSNRYQLQDLSSMCIVVIRTSD